MRTVSLMSRAVTGSATLLFGALVIAGCNKPAPAVTTTPNAAPPAAATGQPAAPPVAVAPTQPDAGAPVAAAPTGAAAPTSFQPYTVLPALPPKPKVVVKHHARLQLTQTGNHYHLVDDERHQYDVARDSHGDLYPVYHDPASSQTYPLYYDSDRDRYYRVVRDPETHHYYRGYADEPGDRYYEDDRARPDESYYSVAEEHRPVIVTPPHHARNRDAAWLLAIPVVAGAYLLLQPHHHNARAPIYPNARPGVVRTYGGNPGRPQFGTRPGEVRALNGNGGRPQFGTRPGAGRPVTMPFGFNRPAAGRPVTTQHGAFNSGRPSGHMGSPSHGSFAGAGHNAANSHLHGMARPGGTQPGFTPASIRTRPGAGMHRPAVANSPRPSSGVGMAQHSAHQMGVQTRPGNMTSSHSIGHAAVHPAAQPHAPRFNVLTSMAGHAPTPNHSATHMGTVSHRPSGLQASGSSARPAAASHRPVGAPPAGSFTRPGAASHRPAVSAGGGSFAHTGTMAHRPGTSPAGGSMAHPSARPTTPNPAAARPIVHPAAPVHPRGGSSFGSAAGAAHGAAGHHGHIPPGQRKKELDSGR